MINLAAHFFRNSNRQWFQRDKGYKWPIIFLLFILSALTLLQMNIISKPEESYTQTAGWIVLSLFCIFVLFGLVSNRLPSRMEDVMWLYTLPVSMNYLVWVCIGCQLFLRSGFWVGSALLADLIRWLMGFTYEQLFGKAIISLCVVSLLEIWLFAASTSRGKWRITVILGVSSVAGLCATALTLYFIHAGVYTSSVYVGFVQKIAHHFGALLFGQLSYVGFIMIVALFGASILVIRIASKHLDLKEKLTREADFWSSFNSFGSLVTSVKGSEHPSYWGGKALTGIYSFVWFEWLLWRKHRYSLLWQFALGAALAIIILQWYPSWFWLLNGFVLVSAVLGAYFSGLVRHTQTGDLFLHPGKKMGKVILLEAMDLLPPFVTVLLYSCMGLWLRSNEVYEQLQLLIWLPLIFFIMVCMRIGFFVWTYIHHSDLPVTRYYRTLFIHGAGISVIAYFAAYIIQLLIPWFFASYMIALFLIGAAYGGISIKKFNS
ncbi:sporulation killing factor system integral membrane protein [Candidatus Pristimantibacillus sp. PTI5]|uniref:sporulation killing factor system integral membrane protein n=1 Tax=Candidatus Pristimantibacillus sp. PTI5 TaxID=3400422 RepID=UPI003B01813C